MTKTVHPEHGEDVGPIGVTKDNDADVGFMQFWSWKCWCGVWWDGYHTREDARTDYRDHKNHCPFAKGRVAQRHDLFDDYYQHPGAGSTPDCKSNTDGA